MKNSEKLVYSLNVEDIQEVAQQILDRELNEKEIALVEASVGDYISWFDAIEFAIRKQIKAEDEDE